MRYCIAIKRSHAGSFKARALAESIGTNIFVGNQARVWVDSDLTLAEIEALDWVESAVVSFEQRD